ncbi:MAG TPA: hypothetical protein VGI48_01145 [Caldimonas sp.]|jgi:hypothetical protein
MPTGFGRTATHDLTHVGLTLAPRRKRGRWLVIVGALVVAALAAGLGAGELLRENAPPVVVRAAAPPSVELLQARRQLEQARAALRIAEARGQELEHQVDSLNQKLNESQDELTFFRKAREGRKH